MVSGFISARIRQVVFRVCLCPGFAVLIMLTAAVIGSSLLEASDHGGGGHGGGHGAPPAHGGGHGGGGHGDGGHGEAAGGEEAKPKKSTLPPWSNSPVKTCIRPKYVASKALPCGSPQHQAYRQAVETYNECIIPVANRPLLSVAPCRVTSDAGSEPKPLGAEERTRLREALNPPANPIPEAPHE